MNCINIVKDPFRLRDSTMWYRTHDNLNTFNNGLRPLKTKSPPNSLPRITPPDFVLSVPNPLLKVIKLSCVLYYMVLSRSATEPLVWLYWLFFIVMLFVFLGCCCDITNACIFAHNASLTPIDRCVWRIFHRVCMVGSKTVSHCFYWL